MIIHTPLVTRETHKEKHFLRCHACARACAIAEGMRGVCGIRINRDRMLDLEAYGKPGAVAVDPVEKKPLYHFMPGTRVLSLGTYGCNFFCKFCQNWQLSQAYRLGLPRETYDLPPEAVIRLARETESQGIAYTYNEPVTWIEYAHDSSLLAQPEYYTVFVSSGYETLQAWVYMHGLLDAANIDLKAFSEEFYRDIVTARLHPVLESIQHAKELGFWIELTTLIIPGYNDSEDELRRLARFIARLDPFIPWHVTRFHPDYQMMHVPPTPLERLKRAYEIGREEGLKYVYIGNIRTEENHTYCHACGVKLVHREGFATLVTDHFDLAEGKCKACGARIPGVWNPAQLKAHRKQKAEALSAFLRTLPEEKRGEMERILKESEKPAGEGVSSQEHEKNGEEREEGKGE